MDGGQRGGHENINRTGKKGGVVEREGKEGDEGKSKRSSSGGGMVKRRNKRRKKRWERNLR